MREKAIRMGGHDLLNNVICFLDKYMPSDKCVFNMHFFKVIIQFNIFKHALKCFYIGYIISCNLM